ncbi:hypothetical protein ScPMuIL_015241 [Solemya velum]
MEVLAKIVRRYDILLIQEIRDSAGTAIKRLLEKVNSDGSQFEIMVSDRLGRGNSKEQYAYFYRASSNVTVLDSYHYDDGDEALGSDTFEREPFTVRFSVPKTVIGSLSIVGVHVRPDSAVQEIESLRDVYDDVRRKWADDNVLIMGDLNADCSYVTKTAMKKLTMRSDFYWPIGDDVDTTVAKTDCAYDSTVPFRFDTVYGLTPEQTGDVSDHYPIELELVSRATRTWRHGAYSILCVLLCAKYVF